MAAAAGWERFMQVTTSVPTGHDLYRASAPNYDNQDSDQNLTQAAVDFLVSQGINSIISYNAYEYTAAEKARLTNAVPPIKYLHLKLEDFKPPTLAQLEQANDFFLENTSTLVHCGYGMGRTGTGITGLQIYTVHGASLQPLAATWTSELYSNPSGNNVETREQVSILAQQRNLFLPRVTGIPAGNPNQAYAIINFATGYYLTLSTDKLSVITLSPETVETASTIAQAYQWVVTNTLGDYTLSNKTTPTSFALTKSEGALVDDTVTYGAEAQGNILFTISEVTSGDNGRYVISPKPSPGLAVAINTPSDDVGAAQPMPALLATNSTSNSFGLWILLSSDFNVVGLQ
ncbi:hypothetical protein J3R82DRAFT_10320 [Butyriboletus roseoflavus]|nr:hypothetical protein J3R82DRAFT_10320 [Butyriboletus roseoflavus]